MLSTTIFIKSTTSTTWDDSALQLAINYGGFALIYQPSTTYITCAEDTAFMEVEQETSAARD